MAALTDLSDLLNRASGGNSGAPEKLWRFYDGRIGNAAPATPPAARWISLWNYNNSRNPTSSTPGAAAVPTRTTNGALKQTNAASGQEKWFIGLEGSLVAGTLLVYDRLLHCGGLNGTTTTAQTVGGTLTRNTGGEGNQIWVEIYTDIGATARTITASYTNQSGTSGRTTQAVNIGNTGLREAQRMIPLVLQDGDTGVQSVASVTLSGSTGTAGDFGVTVVRPIMTAFCAGTGGVMFRDLVSGLPPIQKIDDDACLALAFFSYAGTVPFGHVGFMFVES